MVVSKKSKSKTSVRKSSPLSSKTVIELRTLAKEKGVVLTGITRKADIIKALSGTPKKKAPSSSGLNLTISLKDYLTLPDIIRHNILNNCIKQKGLKYCQGELEYAQFNGLLTPKNQKTISNDLEYIKKK